VYTRADTLRGSYTTPARAWWDVTFYDLHVTISPADSSVRGYNRISYRVLREPAILELQVDLMQPLEVDSIVQDARLQSYRREGNASSVTLGTRPVANTSQSLTVYYHRRPEIAKTPPWQSGFTWSSASLGRPWVVTTDQGMGASVWWPNKAPQADEPDSQRVALTLPDPMINVSNGRLRSTTRHTDGTPTYERFLVNPLNNHAIAVAAGNYAHH